MLLNLEMVATAVLGVALFGEHLGRLGWLGVAGVVAAGALVADHEPLVHAHPHWPDLHHRHAHSR